MSEVTETPFSARVIAVQDDIVTIESSAPLMKNEVVYVRPGRRGADERQERLKSEVLRVRGRQE